MNSAADFVAYLKANKTLLIDNLANSIPNDSIKAQATALVNAAKAALAPTTSIAFKVRRPPEMVPPSTPTAVRKVDGTPLPANFAAGKGTPMCTAEAILSAGAGNAATPAQELAFLVANQSTINGFAAGIPSAPSDIQTAANTLVTTTKAAIASNDPNQMGAQPFQQAANTVDLYCGDQPLRGGGTTCPSYG